MRNTIKTKPSISQHNLFDSFTYQKESKPGFVRETATDLTFRNADTKYLTHNFHSYPAKFIPQLATWLIKEVSEIGQTILDPFAGSGTTLVEAVLHDRNAVGVEINPIGQLTTLSKITPINPLLLHIEKENLFRRTTSSLSTYQSKNFFGFAPTASMNQEFDLWIPTFENFEKWFLPEVILELAVIRNELMKIENKDIQRLGLVAFSSIVKSVSNARTEERNPKLRKVERKKPDTLKLFRSKLDRMSIDIIAFTERVKNKSVDAKLIGNDARKLECMNDQIDLIVTSPPYAYAMDYVRMHKLSLYWLGEIDLTNLDSKFIGTERVYRKQYIQEFDFHLPFTREIINQVTEKNKKKGYILYKYFCDMELCFREMYRILKKNGHATIVIGNSTIQQVLIPTHECFNEIAVDIGFDIKKPLVRSIPRESKGLSNVHVELGGEMVDKEYINIFIKK